MNSDDTDFSRHLFNNILKCMTGRGSKYSRFITISLKRHFALEMIWYCENGSLDEWTLWTATASKRANQSEHYNRQIWQKTSLILTELSALRYDDQQCSERISCSNPRSLLERYNSLRDKYAPTYNWPRVIWSGLK